MIELNVTLIFDRDPLPPAAVAGLREYVGHVLLDDTDLRDNDQLLAVNVSNVSQSIQRWEHL